MSDVRDKRETKTIVEGYFDHLLVGGAWSWITTRERQTGVKCSLSYHFLKKLAKNRKNAPSKKDDTPHLKALRLASNKRKLRRFCRNLGNWRVELMCPLHLFSGKRYPPIFDWTEILTYLYKQEWICIEIRR